jgi:cytochrome b561
MGPKHQSTAQHPQNTNHPRSTRYLHWLTALSLLAVATTALIRDEVASRLARQWLLEGHRHLGLLILVLAALRIALRLRRQTHPRPAQAPAMRIATWLTHAALYAALLALPLLGWALSDAAGKPPHLFGLALPALAAEDDDLADRLLAWHQDLAWVLLVLVSLHIAAALWHHFIRRDDVLRAMWPARQT